MFVGEFFEDVGFGLLVEFGEDVGFDLLVDEFEEGVLGAEGGVVDDFGDVGWV